MSRKEDRTCGLWQRLGSSGREKRRFREARIAVLGGSGGLPWRNQGRMVQNGAQKENRKPCVEMRRKLSLLQTRKNLLTV